MICADEQPGDLPLGNPGIWEQRPLAAKKLILRGSAPSFPPETWSENRIVYLMLNFPYRCNYCCLKCCNLLKPRSPSQKGSRLSQNALRELIIRAAAEGLSVLVIAGEGEPLLDPNFRYTVEQASRVGLIAYVFTNASLLDHEMASFLASHRASLVISLDSINEIRYQQLTRGGNLREVLGRIADCRSLYAPLIEELPHVRMVSLAINTVITSLNADEVDTIRRFCDEDVVFVCNKPTKAGIAESNWNLLYGTADANPLIDNLLDEMAVDYGPLGSTPDSSSCAYMKHGVSIGYEGAFLTCAYSIESAGGYSVNFHAPFAVINRAIVATVEDFYRRKGHSRCILRHPQYPIFLAELHSRLANRLS